MCPGARLPKLRLRPELWLGDGQLWDIVLCAVAGLVSGSQQLRAGLSEEVEKAWDVICKLASPLAPGLISQSQCLPSWDCLH